MLNIVMVIVMYVFTLGSIIMMIGIIADRLNLRKKVSSDRQLNFIIGATSISLYIAAVIFLLNDWAVRMIG